MKNNLLLLLSFILLSNHSFGEDTASSEKDSMVTHVVMVWLKAEVSAQQREIIMSSAQQLAEIPGVMRVQSGLAIASERPIVDDSFSFGINIQLTNAAQLNQYLQHPIHVNYVDTHIKGNTRKLLIYDF